MDSRWIGDMTLVQQLRRRPMPINIQGERLKYLY